MPTIYICRLCEVFIDSDMQTGMVLSATGPFSLLNLPKLLRFANLLQNNILAIGNKISIQRDTSENKLVLVIL